MSLKVYTKIPSDINYEIITDAEDASIYYGIQQNRLGEKIFTHLHNLCN